MKTNKLIKLLQNADPTGEAEVCVSNQDILDVASMPAYYDGRQEILIRDESLNCYDVIGGKITSLGTKIKIITHGLDEALMDHPDLPIDLSECQDNGRYAKLVEVWRKAAKDLSVEIEADKWKKD
jgi:hypothetical protein